MPTRTAPLSLLDDLCAKVAGASGRGTSAGPLCPRPRPPPPPPPPPPRRWDSCVPTYVPLASSSSSSSSCSAAWLASPPPSVDPTRTFPSTALAEPTGCSAPVPCPHVDVATHCDGTQSCRVCGVVVTAEQLVSLARESQCDEADDGTTRADAWCPKTGRDVAATRVETAEAARWRHARASGSSVPRRVSRNASAAVALVRRDAIESNRRHEGLSDKGEAFNRALQRLLDKHFVAARTPPSTQEAVRLGVFDIVRKTEAHRLVCRASKCSQQWRFAGPLGRQKLVVAVADVVAADLPPSQCTERLAEHLRGVGGGGVGQFRSALRHVLSATMDEVRKPCEAKENRTDPDKEAIHRIAKCAKRLHKSQLVTCEETHRVDALLTEDSVGGMCLEALGSLGSGRRHDLVARALLAAAHESRGGLLREAVAACPPTGLDMWKLVLDLRVAASAVPVHAATRGGGAGGAGGHW
jgi:hypothetical protein